MDTTVYRTRQQTSLGITINPQTINTRNYHKPSDNKQYLHYHSVHPRKQKESVSYGLLIRSKRICSEQKYFEQEARKILQQLKYRKYPQQLLDEAYWKVNNMRRQDLLRSTTDKENTKIRLITNYNPNNPDLRMILKKYEGLLLMTRNEVIKPDDIQVTYSRSPNIKDMIINSEIFKQHTPNIVNHVSSQDVKLVNIWTPLNLLPIALITAIQLEETSTVNIQI